MEVLKTGGELVNFVIGIKPTIKTWQRTLGIMRESGIAWDEMKKESDEVKVRTIKTKHNAKAVVAAGMTCISLMETTVEIEQIAIMAFGVIGLANLGPDLPAWGVLFGEAIASRTILHLVNLAAEKMISGEIKKPES